MISKRIRIRAPGRICLFGEHQDYLGYPVIAGSINKYIFIEAYPLSEKDPENDPSLIQFIINMPDLKYVTPKKISIPKQQDFLFKPLSYSSNRDYLLSCVNVAHHQGARWENSWEIILNGTIPINAGASSSSAMVVAWLLFLLTSGNKLVRPEELAEYGYISEVSEFNESGGMMDHFASACGNLIFLSSQPEFTVKTIRHAGPDGLNGFVLANSGVKKSTVDDLRNTKKRALLAFENLKKIYPKFNKFKSSIEDVKPYLPSLSQKEELIAVGNLKNRDLTLEGFNLLNRMDINSLEDQKSLGNLLYNHHKMLSKNIGVSIPKIDEMVEITMESGAWGGKINGSGFGGTMFAYAPNCQEKVRDALNDAGYDAWMIDISSGASISSK